MEGFEQERRGLFDGLTVPHSLNAILIAALGLLVYYAGIRGMENALPDAIPGDGSCRVIAGMLGNLTARMGTFGAIVAKFGGWTNKAASYNVGIWILFWGWSAVVWSFFSGAINRIAALKLAREESLEFMEALKFGFHKFLPNLLSIVFVFAIGGFFYIVTNATIAGWLGRIPYVGDIIVGVFFVLVLISSFLIVFVGALGILGFNLSSAAIATESSDTFDGVSRSWNYILARPWTVLLTYVATFAYIGVILFFGDYFLRVSVKSLSVDFWGMGTASRLEDVDDTRDREKLKLPKDVHEVRVPGKADYLYGSVIGKKYRPSKGEVYYQQSMRYSLELYRRDMGEYPQSLNHLLYAPKGEHAKDWAGPYLDGRLPKDEFEQDFVYVVDDPKKHNAYEFLSVGRDGKADTKDDVTLDAFEEEHGPMGKSLNVHPIMEGTMSFAYYALKIWVNIARILIFAYVVAYFFCAQTMVYFLLRKDIEGDDYSEITLEDTFDDDEGPFDYQEPAKPPAAKKKETTEKKSLPMADKGEKKDESEEKKEDDEGEDS